MPSKLLLKLRSALVCALSVFATASLAQTTRNVGPGQPYTTIQSGINAANNGDTVLVAPGTYTENINFNGKAITVTSSGGPTVTTIDGGGVGSTVTMTSQEPRAAVLSSFTITHGGIAHPSTVGSLGAGVSVTSSAPTILNNVITQNYCQNIQTTFSAPLIQGNVVSSSLNPAQCFVGNTGGINIEGTYQGPNAALTPLIIGNTIENNTTGQIGDGGGDGGAGIWSDATSSLLIQSNIIRNNTTITGYGGGILVYNASPVVIVNNLIYGNSAGCGGGGIHFMAVGPASPYNVLIANNTIADNTSTGLGGYSDCRPIQQIAQDSFTYGGATPTNAIVNNIISGSTSQPAIDCGVFGPQSELYQPSFQNNILYNAGGPFFGSTCVDVSAKYNNVAANPQFVSPSPGDYHLLSTSPAIDTGQNSVLQTIRSMVGAPITTDLDGNSRIQDATGHGCLIDIGAYEYPGTKSLCGTTETLTSSLNPSTLGGTVTFTAQLSSTNSVPTGNIQFSDGNTVLGTEPVSPTGASTFSTSLLSVGSHTITAAFQPTGNFPAENASLTQVVNGYPSTTTLASSLNPATAGQAVTFTAAVTSQNGAPTGSVTFADGATSLAVQPLSSGTATYSTSTLAVGPHQITATYTPSGTLAGSSATLTQTINGQPTATTLAVTPNPASAFGTLNLVSTVSAASGSPSGSITFSANGVNLGSATLNANGQATLSVATPSPGTYSITAAYSGNPSFNPSTSPPVSETVLAASSATSLTASPNPAYQGQGVTLSASVTGAGGQTPQGTVTFYDGSAALGTGSLSASGIASITVNTLTPGTHNLTASYPGNAGYAGSSSSSVQEVILPGTFRVALSPSAITLRSGQGTTVGVSLTSIGGFSGPLALSSGTTPAYASAAISPATVTLTAGGNGTANLVLNTATAQAKPPTLFGTRGSAAALTAFALLLLPPLRRGGRKRWRNVLGTLLLSALLVGAQGCGTIGFPFHTAVPGTYRLPVSATDRNGNTQTTLLTITLTP